jgi:hypothetical protein
MRSMLRRKAAAMSAALLSAAVVAACTTSEASPAPVPRSDLPGPGAGAGAPAGGARSTTSIPSTTVTTRDTPAPTPNLVPLRTANGRRSPGVIAAGGRDAPYNYAPSVMADGGLYRMWWCSQLGIANPPGDDILYAESRSLGGGFRAPDGTAAMPVHAGGRDGFDAMHACDPSVLRAGTTYFMYYTGSPGDHAHSNSIGLATSPDGRMWTRANGGAPIVRPARNVDNGNLYGAGQPSAVYLDGWFYLMFTDTTGQGSGPNGAGQFLLRAKDPAFAGGVEELTAAGFRPARDTASRHRSVVDAFSADLMWVDALAAFAIAHETETGTTITFWDKDFQVNPYKPVVVEGPWREGPGLVRRADGHAVVPLNNPCDGVPVDLVRATREGPAGPTDLMHFGLDLMDVGACRDTDRALLALNGYAMPSPQRTVDLIMAGTIVRVDRRSVAEALAVQILDRRVPALDKVPVSARITAGVPAVRAPDRGMALVIDDRLWPLIPMTAVERNSSAVVEITQQRWDAYERGADLVAPPR